MTYTYRFVDDPESRLEFQQSMLDPHLTVDPATGRAIERVVTGGSQTVINTPKQKAFSLEDCRGSKAFTECHGNKPPGSFTVPFGRGTKAAK